MAQIVILRWIGCFLQFCFGLPLSQMSHLLAFQILVTKSQVFSILSIVAPEEDTWEKAISSSGKKRFNKKDRQKLKKKIVKGGLVLSSFDSLFLLHFWCYVLETWKMIIFSFGWMGFLPNCFLLLLFTEPFPMVDKKERLSIMVVKFQCGIRSLWKGNAEGSLWLPLRSM